MSVVERIPRSVCERLGYYVYAYVEPSTGRISYVGKGKGQRALAHLVRLNGHRVDVLAHGLPDEASTLAVEAAVIDALGLSSLTNKVRGHCSGLSGRLPLTELLLRYAAKRVEVREPSILIRLTRKWRPGMSAEDLYEATRTAWRVRRRRSAAAKYAMAVHGGIVREVYEIDSWHPAGATRRRKLGVKDRGRFEFVGRVASREVRRRYVGGSVEHVLPDGARNPIRYVP